MYISGTIFWYYTICKREVWLMSRQIVSEQENDFLMLGRMIHDKSYKLQKKEIVFENCKFDMITGKSGKQIIGEIKKSSKSIDSAIMQLKYYLYRLHKRSINTEGVIKIPTEKKTVPVKLELSDIETIDKMCIDIENIIQLDIPPLPEYKRVCNSCSYADFCFS